MPDNQIEKRTVIDSPSVQERESPRASPLILSVAAASQSMTPWGTNPKRRDQELRNFWIGESWLASVVYLVSIRNASFAWEIVGSDPTKPNPKNTINKVTQILKNSNRGKGWQNLIIKTCIDLYTADNGSFWEIIRIRNKPDAPVINIVHLDSAQCLRTGDPDYPVIYTDRKGKEIALPYWRVHTLEEFPSPYESAFSLQYCLLPDSTVKMADGKTKRIRDLVNSRSEERVLTVAMDGQLTEKRIIGWHKNDLGDRKLINIRGKNAKASQGDKDTNSWVTDDHPILSSCGWKKAGELKTGDKVVTRFPGLTNRQIQVLIGSLMGDASLSKKCDTARLSIGHCERQVEWLRAKEKAFSNLSPQVYKDEKRSIYHLLTPVQPVLNYFYEQFYPDGKKKFPISLIKEYFSPLLLATWFLDDGSTQKQVLKKTGEEVYYASIGTTGCSLDILKELSEFLSEQGYECRVRKSGYKGKYNLGFTKKGSKILFSAIAQYVPHCMRYKMPTGMLEYCPEKWNVSHPAVRFMDEIEIETENHPRVKTVYCIDVEDTHNFITANMVVHNCATTRALMAAEIIESISVYKQEKVGGQFTRAVDIVGGVTANDIQDAVAVIKEQALNRGLYRFSMPVLVPGIDPSNTLSHVHIDLASLPDNFDEDTSFKWYVAQLAAAFGVDYQEIAPLMTGNLGSSQQSEIMHLKTRGKGPAIIMSLFEGIINGGLIPSNVTFRFKEQDLRAETEKANARFTRGKDRAFRLKAGEIDVQAARQLAVTDGDLPEWLVQEMDEREQEMPTNNEVGPAQLEGGIETQAVKMTLADANRIRQKISADPYGFLKSSFGNPSATVIARIRHTADILSVQNDLVKKYRFTGTRYTPEQQFHITLVHSPLADDVDFKNVERSVRERLRKLLPVKVSVSHLSYFDEKGAYPIVLLVDKGLEAIQQLIYEECLANGLPVSEYSLPSKWTPHITLGYMPYVPESFNKINSFDIIVSEVAFTRTDYLEESTVWGDNALPLSR